MKLPTSRFFLALLPGVLALGQSQTVAFTAGNGRLQLAGNGVDGQILLSANDWWGVIRAAADLAGDVGKVTGRNLTLGNWKAGGPTSDTVLETRGQNNTETRGAETTVLYTYFPTTNNVNVSNLASSYQHAIPKHCSRTQKYTVGPAETFTGPTLISNSSAKTVIIAGTIEKSDLIDALVSSHRLDISAIENRWESFISQVVDSPLPGVEKALVIAGSDMRGTIFGLYDVSEQIGVSPWWWFADVPVRKAKGIWALTDAKKVQKEPSVK